MPEFSCFLHPQLKADSLDDVCPECGQLYGFPLLNLPESINGMGVEKGLNRGFYGAVFLTTHPRTGRQSAVKVIPILTYGPKEAGGYAKNFYEEAELHSQLSKVTNVAALRDWGEETLSFGAFDIPCYFMEMEYIDGPTLSELIYILPPSDPRIITQIALDLLDIIGEFQQRGVFHNDLHGHNIIVLTLREEEARRRAVHPTTAIKVLDLGSAADQSKSDTENQRLGDVHWVAQHIFDLLNAYEASQADISPDDLRLVSQLRRVAEFYSGKDPVRQPTVEDMRVYVMNAHRFGSQPWAEAVRLESFDTHYNALTLPPHFAPSLLYDPDDIWAHKLMRPGPQLLTGMRGCGKTMLLRSLEWMARIHQRESEGQEDLLQRIADETYLGLFVSSSSLLRGPRREPIDLSLHRLFLAFARELVRNVHACELRDFGTINFDSLESLSDLIKSIVPWYEEPAIRIDAVSVERAISRALQIPSPAMEQISRLNTRNTFDELARLARTLVDLWKNKKLLFLLDDVSTRYLPLDDINELLSELSIQSPDFGFVLTTERQTLELTTPGGQVASQGRDYMIFDLGEEVRARLKGKQGLDFIENVLMRRAAITDAVPLMTPSDVLGRQSMSQIAANIREKPGDSGVYWGFDALVGMCVGDIGDILQLYSRMLSRMTRDSFPIDHSIQDDAITSFAQGKLFNLAGHDPWLYSHAVTFAQASHNELTRDTDRLRQYGTVFVHIDPAQAEQAVPRIIRLVDEGVFIFAGATRRTKTTSGKPSLLFKLAFRKILGAANRMPLSSRDRFEVTTSNLLDWLESPRPNLLALARRRSSPVTNVETVEPLRSSSPDHSSTPIQQQFIFRESPIDESNRSFSKKGQLPDSRLIHEVKSLSVEILPAVTPTLVNSHILAAIGFEDRTIGAWKNLLEVMRPDLVTLLKYSDPGYEDLLLKLLQSYGVRFEIKKVGSRITQEEARMLLESANGRQLVIDTTSLTKALIFQLVRSGLVMHSDLWVLHTCAAEYFPNEALLIPIISLFESSQYPEAFRQLDDIVAGEQGPFSVESIEPVNIDASLPSFVVTLVALKHNRVNTILESTPVDQIAAIYPVHTVGDDSPRSKISRIVAEYLAGRYGGDTYPTGSLDHADTYLKLLDLHRQYALEGGHNFQIALSGTKLQVVGSAMLASIAAPAAVYYSTPSAFDPGKFTSGTAETRLIHLQRAKVN